MFLGFANLTSMIGLKRNVAQPGLEHKSGGLGVVRSNRIIPTTTIIPPSSIGLGRLVLNQQRGVRFPLEVPRLKKRNFIMGFVGISQKSRASNFPREFSHLPLLQPPDMTASNNPSRSWIIYEDWKAPAIDGKQVCVRGPVKLANDCWYGFFTDGISVPQLAWSLFNLYPFSMPELCGALGHDIAYSAELADRKTCDIWMDKWEKMATVNKVRRQVIYRVLRTFGGFVWNKHTEESIAAARTMCQLVNEGEEPVWGDLLIT